MTTKTLTSPTTAPDPEALLFSGALTSPATTADALSQYDFATRRCQPAEFAARLVDLHQRAIENDNQALAALLRDEDAGLEDLAAAAASLVQPVPREQISVTRRRVASEVVQAVKAGMAEQIAARASSLAPVARQFLAELADRQRREAEKRAQVERAAAERAAAAAEREAAERAAEEERLAAERAADLERELALNPRAGGDEVERLERVVGLRQRLRRSRVSTVRITGRAYGTIELSHALRDASGDFLDAVAGAIDRAEGRVS